jgi:histidyl-tRNA synthetase
MSYALKNAEKLRDAGIDTIINCGGGAVKRQLRRADQSGAQLVVVIGADESMNGYATVKSLREDGGQIQVNESNLADYVCTRLREEQK